MLSLVSCFNVVEKIENQIRKEGRQKMVLRACDELKEETKKRATGLINQLVQVRQLRVANEKIEKIRATATEKGYQDILNILNEEE